MQPAELLTVAAGITLARAEVRDTFATRTRPRADRVDTPLAAYTRAVLPAPSIAQELATAAPAPMEALALTMEHRRLAPRFPVEPRPWQLPRMFKKTQFT